MFEFLMGVLFVVGLILVYVGVLVWALISGRR